MQKFRSALSAWLFVVTSLAFTSLAQAQAVRTYVSGVGDDDNPCSRTAPCRTFAGAIAKTNTGGEINALDAGGYGTVVISKSITIDGSGPLSSILASNGATGIMINAPGTIGTPSAVRLRGLSINGAGSGSHGIRVMAASNVSVEECVIDGFTGNGINVESTSATRLFAQNTTIRNNTGSGITVVPGGAQVALSGVALVFNGVAVSSSTGAVLLLQNNAIYSNGRRFSRVIIRPPR